MVLAGFAAAALCTVVLISGGVALFDHEEGLLDSTVGGWAAWAGVLSLHVLPAAAFLSPLAYALRHRPGRTAPAAMGTGGLLIVAGCGAALVSPSWAWSGPLLRFGITVGLLGALVHLLRRSSSERRGA
jgi:hypothetical protein